MSPRSTRQERTERTTARKWAFRAAALLPAVLIGALGGWLYLNHLGPEARARTLNLDAWEATFRERGLPVPPDGPREGVWADRLRKVEDERLGWREVPVDLPRLIAIDSLGMQHVGDPDAATRILIVGASVAWGADASTIEDTYFATLVDELAELGVEARATVFAAGAWKSEQEVTAAEIASERADFDLVVYLNGLNDLTNGVTHDDRFRSADEEHAADYEARVETYARQMRHGAEQAARRGQRMLVVLQPSLAERVDPGPVEEELLDAHLARLGDISRLRAAYAAMRQRLRVLSSGSDHVHVLDASRIFASERVTTFADLWHFSDPGHAILGRAMARKLARILRAGGGVRSDTVTDTIEPHGGVGPHAASSPASRLAPSSRPVIPGRDR